MAMWLAGWRGLEGGLMGYPKGWRPNRGSDQGGAAEQWA